ncbi:hypothetical protein KP07_01525 [Candidatus Liberibacter solanacearum]|nr:hypothetical protein [Candidatus Liberibacter solanacearum]KJZ81201.1 hypothetical protein KP07_01525 [Candidatus Liberibacter solanacearum]
MNRVISTSIAAIIAITVMLSSCNSSEEKSNTEDKGIEETQKSIPSTQETKETQATPAETKTKIETPLQLPQSNKTGGENTNTARNDTTDEEKSNKNKVEHSKNLKKNKVSI